MIDLFGSDSDDWEDDDFGADLAEAVEVHCPYCGAGIDLGVDQSGGGVQEYVEDCQVCCQPLMVRVTLDGDGVPAVLVNTLDES